MSNLNEINEPLDESALFEELQNLQQGGSSLPTPVPAGPGLPDYPIDEGEAEHRRLTIGTDDVPVSDLRCNEIYDTVHAAPWMTQEDAPAIRRNVRLMLQDMGPRDEIEVQIVQHIIAAHFATMASFRAAWQNSPDINVRDIYLKNAARLSDLHTKLVAALDKHRAGGKQEMKVTYVHVDQGAQAIVGDVEMKGCTKRRGKTRGNAALAGATPVRGPSESHKALQSRVSDDGASS